METGKVFSIAVLGSSTKGKTTYIASLCEKMSVRNCGVEQKGMLRDRQRSYVTIIFTVDARNGSDAKTSRISEICIYRERLMSKDDGAFDDAVQNLLQKIGVTEEKLRGCLAEENYLVRIPVNNMSIYKGYFAVIHKNLDLFATLATGYIDIISVEKEDTVFMLELKECSKRIFHIPKIIFCTLGYAIESVLVGTRSGINEVLLKKSNYNS